MKVSRRGFALLLVLWMLVGVAILAAGLVSAGRYALQATTNRMLLTQGAWWAEGCVERARAAINEALTDSSAGDLAWQSLDAVVTRSPLSAECDIEVRPVGVTLDVNAASSEQIRLTVLMAGASTDQADSVADAIADWQDADDLTRNAGAEGAWYRANGRLLPRNGPIVAREELRRVRGVDALSGIDSLLDVEPGRILIGRAPAAVLAALPGFGPEAVARAVGLPIGSVRDLVEFSATLSPLARDELQAHFADLQQHVTLQPDAWIVTARARAGQPPVMSTIEIRLVRAGKRAAVVRRRSWP